MRRGRRREGGAREVPRRRDASTSPPPRGPTTASCASTPRRRRRFSTCASSASRASSARRSSAEYREVLAADRRPEGHPREERARRGDHPRRALGDQGDVRPPAPHGDRGRGAATSRPRTSSPRRRSSSRSAGAATRRGRRSRSTARRNAAARAAWGPQTKEEDVVEHLFVGSTHDYLLAFTNKGRVHWVKLYDVPSGGPATRGKALVNLLALEEGERVAAMATTRTFPDDRYPALRDEARPREEDGALGVRKPAREGDHRDQARGRRRAALGADHGRDAAGLPRHAPRHGDQVLRDGRPADGTRHDGRQGDRAAGATTSSSRWTSSRRRARSSRSPRRATASGRTSRSIATRRAAARASST